MEETNEKSEQVIERVELKKELIYSNNNEVAHIESKTHIHKVGSAHEAPEYLVDNEYIFHGYRINFNSTKKVAQSLFMLHNESVNIWSHLIGTILVLILVVYTTLSISSNTSKILGSFNFNITKMNDEIKHVSHPVVQLLPDLHNITSNIGEKYESGKSVLHELTENIIEKTVEYVGAVEEKIGIYKGYINCYHCIEDIFHTLKSMKENIGDHVNKYTDIVVNESKHLLESIEDSSVIHFIEDVKDKLVNLKDKLTDLVDSHEMSWIDIYEQGGEDYKRLTKWPVFIMLISAIICLSCSAIFHWFSAHSKSLHDLLNRLDYAGISILIAGSCYPPYYYFFYCEPVLRTVYLTFISTFAISVFFYSFKPDFNTPSKRRLRGSLFLTLGLSTAFPILHLALFPHTVKGFSLSPQLIYWYLGGISYVTGALIYILRIPERFRPGKHDIWGSSHQIFHMFVLLGVCFHYIGSLDAYYYRVNYFCPIS